MFAVTELRPEDVARVDSALPLNRLDQHRETGSTYLIAWKDDEPVGHAHLAWSRTHLGLPEVQDVYVLPALRRQGVARSLSAAAEELVRGRGLSSISLSVSRDRNEPARLLYQSLGYVDAGVEPVRVSGTITLRGRPFDVDDTLVYLVKHLR